MPVYVDQIVDYRASISPQLARRAGSKFCHMTADTLEELHEMADKIGMRREWFQPAARLHHCHYDLVPSRRARAVALGAVEVKAMEHARQLQADGRVEILAPPEVREAARRERAAERNA